MLNLLSLNSIRTINIFVKKVDEETYITLKGNFKYLPKDLRKNSIPSSFLLSAKPRIVCCFASDRLRMLCKRQCGEISITIACFGTLWRASWKNTGLTRLLARYSEQQNSAAVSVFLFDTDVLIQFLLLLFGDGTICKKKRKPSLTFYFDKRNILKLDKKTGVEHLIEIFNLKKFTERKGCVITNVKKHFVYFV